MVERCIDVLASINFYIAKEMCTHADRVAISSVRY